MAGDSTQALARDAVPNSGGAICRGRENGNVSDIDNHERRPPHPRLLSNCQLTTALHRAISVAGMQGSRLATRGAPLSRGLYQWVPQERR
eukprot:CAMPEP_0115371832 /NCGR_PEP_ID=MMETSP0271-20121206/588_1 /TAXON_ID=71861 /ORGANISM="Scrippsiella trochoidea, Strain CCMP3099" /LENGTH=89 /DNA_ID=CAMNT_0002794753 /DNA_START=893 /DNA_END=1158 /DNA_ORIENTATION=+